MNVTIKCPKCAHGRLNFDEHATFQEYFRASNYLADEKGKLLEETIQLYLIYICEKCRKTFHLTFQEVEKALREEIAEKVYQLKAALYIKENFRKSDITGDNTMVLCGECPGFDGKGNCPDSFYNRCILRKKSHGIQLP